MTNEDHSNDKSSDEDTQNGQCGLDLHDVLQCSWFKAAALRDSQFRGFLQVLNRDDGMHLPHEFLNLALRDRT